MDRSELSFPVETLGWVGFLAPHSKSALASRAWSAFTLLQYLGMNLLIFARLASVDFSLSLVTSLVAHSVNLVETVFLRIYFTVRRDAISNLVQDISAVPEMNEPFASADHEMRNNSRRRIKNFCSFVFLFNFAVALLTVLRYMFSSAVRGLNECVPGNDCKNTEGANDHHRLLFDIWWPGNPSVTPVYYFIMAWQLATLFTHISNVAASDAFACSLALAISERSALLTKDAGRALLPGNDNQVTSFCRGWLKYHQNYLRVVATVNEVLGPVFFFTFCIAGLNVITLSYISAKAQDSGLLTSTVTVIAILLVRLFALAYAGQCVHTKSEELSRNSLSAAQVAKGALKDGPARTTLLVLITRLSGGIKPEEISGLGYFAISLEFYTKILSITVSLLLILLQLQE